MSQTRIENTIAFCKPTSLKELQSFMWVVNYFKDHLRDHSAVAKPLYEMVLSDQTKNKGTLLDHRRVRRIPETEGVGEQLSEVILHLLPTTYHIVHRRAWRILMSTT